MYAKIQITGKIEVVTGMHIGGSEAFSPIGSVDSPVIFDMASGLPMIPGSSLKGKMRSLLARQYNEHVAAKPDEDDERLIRLFGSSAAAGKVRRGRLLFSDMILSNREELYERGASGLTEIKFENTINRLTAVANPRQIERVIRGAEFPLDIIYEISGEEQGEAEILEDFRTMRDGMRLLQYDYIGGSGSRGYGKIRFRDISICTVVGELPEALEDGCGAVFTDFVSGDGQGAGE